MFQDGALDLGVDLLRLTGEQLRFGRDHIGTRGNAKFIAALRYVQRQGFRFNRVVQQLLQLILGAQLEIISRKLSLGGEPRRSERRGTGLSGSHVALGGAPNLAPDVYVPVGRDARRISILRVRRGAGATGRYAGRRAGTGCNHGLALALHSEIRRNSGPETSPRLRDQRARLLE